MRRRRTGLAGGIWLAAALLASSAAFTGCGGGGGSAQAVTVPGAPTSVTANAGINSVTLTWSPVSGATSFNIYHGTAPDVTKSSGTKVPGVQSPNVVPGLTNDTPYYFVVTAVNSAGESGISAEKTATPSATPPPLAPGNVRAAASDGRATISWDAVSGAASYNIYVDTSAGVTKGTGIKASGVTSPSVVTPLTNGTKFYFVVTAVGTGGESAESFEVSATPAATPPPAAPGGVSATRGDAQASVSWSTVTGATSYNLYWATASGVTKATGTKIAGVTSPKVVTSLSNGTKYYFVVTAVGAGGESTESAEVFATPSGTPAGAGEIYIADFSDILVYARTASGNAPPARTISGALTGLSEANGIFVDTVNNEIFVANASNDSITVYGKTASGNVAPLRTITGAATGIRGPMAVAVDTVNNEIIVTNLLSSSVSAFYPSVGFYSRTANGNVSPLRMIYGNMAQLGFAGLFFDQVNNEIYMTNGGADRITVYGRTAFGNASPSRTIMGTLTEMNSPCGISVDPVNNEIFVTGSNTSDPKITVYARLANGNAAPLRAIIGAATGLGGPAAVAVDTVNNELLVADMYNESIIVHTRTASGNVAPIRTIHGLATGLGTPFAIAIAP